MEDFEYFTCCLPIREESILLGTSQGKIYRGRLKTPSEIEALDFSTSDYYNVLEEISSEIFSLGGSIRAIEKLDTVNILILSSHGDILCFNIDDNSSIQIQQGNWSKYNKTWRLLIIDENRFLTIGNYKKLKYWVRDGENFESSIQQEFQEFNETHAYFCLNWVDRNNTFIINNYKGHSELWEVSDSSINRVSSFRLDGNLQKCLEIDDYLITVDYYGYIYIFRQEEDLFNKVFEFKISSALGNTIFASLETDFFLIGTDTELIFLDQNFQNIFFKEIPVRKIFLYNDIELILTKRSIVRLDYDSKEVPSSIVNYKYKKIGLVGDHDVGKTTFCRYLKHGELSDEELASEESSLGRHVWTIILEEEYDWIILDDEKRIMYFDIAGQKSEHFTYFPILYDSDVILLFYQATDRDTFDQVIEYYSELRTKCTNAKFYFIQTHSEQRQRPTDRYLERILYQIGLDINTDLIKIDSRTGMGYDDFNEKVLDNLNWGTAAKVFEMPAFGVLMDYFDNIYMTGTPTAIPLTELASFALNLDESRLENIILSLYQRGMIQYLEEEKIVLINYEDYEIMHSEIANLIDEENGYIKTKLIYQELGNSSQDISFIRNILKYFKDNEIGVIFKENDPNKETYIFPRQLNDYIVLTDTFAQNLPKNLTNFKYSNLFLQIEVFLDFLEEYPIELISICKSEFLFKMDHGPDNALLYLSINKVSDRDFIFSLGMNKSEDIDDDLEEKITSFILDNIGHNLKDVSIESDLPSLYDLDIHEQIKYILKNPSERPFIDFKKEYILGTNTEKAEFIKDSIALTNSSIFNENFAFLFIGIEEKHGKIIGIHNVENINDLEPQTAPILDTYVNNHPEINFIEIKIYDLNQWQQDGEISSDITFTNNQTISTNEDKILVMRFKRTEEKVCDVKNIIHFEKRRRQKVYNRGYSWWRINSHAFFISEIEKEILRTK